MKDKLNFDMINEAGQLYADGWPIYDVDVETGFMRIDVMNMLEVRHWGGIIKLRNADGEELNSDDFYNEDS